MGLVALQSVLSAEAASLIGFPAPTVTSLFPGSLRGVTSAPSPVLLRVRVHPLLSRPPLQSSTAPNLPHTQCVWRLPWGFVPHRDISGESPLASELPRSRSTVRPQRFSRSRRFNPLSALRVCFTPQPRPGFTFQGFCSCCQAAPPRRWPLPSCRFATESYRRVASPAPSSSASPPGLCSGQQFETTDRVFSPADASLPS